MSGTAVAHRYAQALLAAEGGDAPEVRAAFAELMAAYEEEPGLRTAIESPRVRTADKEHVLGRLLPQAPKTFGNFLRLLLERGREAEIPAIFDVYRDLWDARAHVAEALVETALPLSPAELKRLQSSLEERFGQRLRVLPRVNAEVLGGVRVRVGDRLLDDTVATRIRRVRRLLFASEVGGQA